MMGGGGSSSKGRSHTCPGIVKATNAAVAQTVRMIPPVPMVRRRAPPSPSKGESLLCGFGIPRRAVTGTQCDFEDSFDFRPGSGSCLTFTLKP